MYGSGTLRKNAESKKIMQIFRQNHHHIIVVFVVGVYVSTVLYLLTR